MIILFTLRFFYEFLKENQSSFEDGLTLNMGQILSIPAILFGVGVLLYAKRKTT
jgi:phosphatidylglycerol:prolipoprotein diacylglycerol transferase